MIQRPRPRLRSSHRSVLVIAPVLLGACAPARAQSLSSPVPSQEGEQGTIEVTGQAQVEVPADRVSISFGVETEAPSASEASTQNAEKMEAVVASLRESGVPGLEVETYGYSLTPEYRIQGREDPSRRSISGYRAMNNIRVTVPGVDRAGEILDAGVGAGANRVVNLQFDATNTREARLEALRRAVGVAREEAQTIAEAMDVALGPPVEVRGGATPGEPRMFARAAMADEMGGVRTPIEAGTQTVSASVTILYRILETAR